MKIIYILFVLSIVLIIALLVASFIYLEKTVHKNLYYLIKVNGEDRGDVEIDNYVTENSIIYKSKVSEPFKAELNKNEIRMELDRETLFLTLYENISSGDGIKELFLLKKENGGLNFLAIAKSKFVYLNGIKAKKDVLTFDREILVTLMPFIGLYNFKKGGSQSFNALRRDIKLLPPSRCTIILTSIKDEYLDIDGRKVKTECLVLKSKGMQEAFLWVDKKDHNIVAMEMPDKQIYIKKTEYRRKFDVTPYILEDPSYAIQEISFSAGDMKLNGVLTRPKKEGIMPACILLQGEDAIDKDNYGIFIDLSDYLAKNGYVVFRFNANIEHDRLRFKAISIEEEFTAIESIINLLSEFRFVDLKRFSIIAHSDANYALPAFLKREKRIKAWVMLSPQNLTPLANTELENIRMILESISQNDRLYKSDIAKSRKITMQIIEESTKNVKNIMGEKVFLKRMKELPNIKHFEDIKNVSMPILALHGKKDDLFSIDYLQKLENHIKSLGQDSSSLVFFRRLNHYLGEIIKEGPIREHYKLDKEILETIAGWLNKNLITVEEPSKTIEPQEITEPQLTN